ncbi:MAG: TetR/AcrR family transcriptional regulator [candidate division Zixibacteria bacterium]|nr:TetR/AcrR family transcriptional regulator [candidate division Zixibacteria bacterium]
MPPKTRFNKEQVIKAAYDIVEKHGWKALSARGVAQKLKSSTAPVYRYFRTMDQLERAVIVEIKDLMIQYTSRPYTERVFLNMGTGYALFARDHKQLFRALFLESNHFKDIVDEIMLYLQEEMGNDPRFEPLSADIRGVLLTKMQTFTHGLATMICVGLINDDSEEYIINTLLDVGGAVIGATLARN